MVNNSQTVSQFSCSVVSDSLRPHELQHTRLPCPSPTPRACSNSVHPTISSSVIPFSSHLQSFPASGPFQVNQFFASGGQSIRVSASASVLPTNIQDWFPKDAQSSSSSLSDHCYLPSLQPPLPHPDPHQAHPWASLSILYLLLPQLLWLMFAWQLLPEVVHAPTQSRSKMQFIPK